MIDTQKKLEDHYIKFIFSSIFEGNTIVLMGNCQTKSICTALSKIFPPGILNVCSELDDLGTISGRRDVTVFVGSDEVNPVFTHLPIQDNPTVNCSLANVFRKVTLVKNIWN